MEYTNKYKVILTSRFKRNLQDIYDYIAFSLKEPDVANELYLKVIKFVLDLEFFPKRYSRLYNNKFKDENLRRLLVDNYIIIFKVYTGTRTNLCFTYISWKSKLH